MAPSLNLIDWQQPWLQDWRETGQRVQARVAQGAPLHAALNDQAASPVRFVPQSELPANEAYEAFIFRTRTCPTREGLHDFFNGLCWLQFPLTKTKLNALQAEQIAQAGVGAVRGPVRDALTVFDENAAFFMGPDVLWEALVARDWQALFVEHRALWARGLGEPGGTGESGARLVLFGHALMEKLVTPRKAITAHVIRVSEGAGVDVNTHANEKEKSTTTTLRTLDAWMAQLLSEAMLKKKPFVALPVAGVPLWSDELQDAAFYADIGVFRPARNLP